MVECLSHMYIHSWLIRQSGVAMLRGRRELYFLTLTLFIDKITPNSPVQPMFSPSDEVATPDCSIGLCGYLDGCSPLLSPSARKTPYCSHIPDPWCWRASGFGYWNQLAENCSKTTGHRGHWARSLGSGNCEGKNRREDAMTRESIGWNKQNYTVRQIMAVKGLWGLLTLKESLSSSWAPLQVESCPAS